MFSYGMNYEKRALGEENMKISETGENTMRNL